MDEKAAIAPNQLQKEPGNPTRLLALVETLPYTAPNPVRGEGVVKLSLVQTPLPGYNRGYQPRQHRRGQRIASRSVAERSTAFVAPAHTVAEVLTGWVGVPEQEIDKRVTGSHGK